MKAGHAMEIDTEMDAFNRQYGIQEYPGYVGAFTRQQADFAIPNGTKIVKSVDEVGDKHRIGDEGVVLGSIPVPEGIPMSKLGPVKFFYWIEFDDHPGYAVAIVSPKIKEAR